MFIVIEGIDGAGCETQATRLIETLKNQGKKPFYIKFPHYDTPVGKMIRDFLYENKVKHTADEQFLLYTLQFIFDKELIAEKMKDHVVIADRYFSTTLCYQTLEGFDESKAVRYAEDFNIIKPDAVLYLDVPPETAIKWKYGEDKEKNFREKDHSFIKRTYEKYDDLVKRNVWAKWIRIQGEQPKENVTEDIIKVINTL
jgi:dTMP kinase